MATFKQQVERIEQEEKNLSSKRQVLSEAIQSEIRNRVCADIGEQFRDNVMALPMQKEQSLLWRWLAGRSEDLAASADAFASAMVEHGYLVRKEMYFAHDDRFDDIELSQEEIDQCVCPVRGEEVSKEFFEQNRYPLWETTAKWAETIDAVYDSDAAGKVLERAKNSYATIQGTPVFTTNELCAALGIQARVSVIQELGFAPVHHVGNSFYWNQADIVAMAEALAARIMENARIRHEFPF